MSPARLNRCISAAPVGLQPSLRQDPTQALRKGREGWCSTELKAWEPARHRSSCREVKSMHCFLRLQQRLLPPTIASPLPAQNLDLGMRAPDTGQGTSFNRNPSLGSRICPQLSPAFRAFPAKTLANSCRLGAQPDWGQQGRSYDCPLAESESLLMDHCCPLWTRIEGERQL